MKQRRPLRFIARFLNGFAWLGMLLGSASLVAMIVLRLMWDIPFDRAHLARTASWMLGCLAMCAVTQTVFLLLNINERVQDLTRR